jgi:hypothetical protein
MMNSMMDLWGGRAIETAGLTDAQAISQMETLAKSVPLNMSITLRSLHCE